MIPTRHSIAKKLLIIYDVFEIEGKGTIIVGRSDDPRVTIERGAHIKLITPNGEEFTVQALHIEYFPKCFSQATQMGISLGDQIASCHIPKETEVWQEV